MSALIYLQFLSTLVLSVQLLLPIQPVRALADLHHLGNPIVSLRLLRLAHPHPHPFLNPPLPSQCLLPIKHLPVRNKLMTCMVRIRLALLRWNHPPLVSVIFTPTSSLSCRPHLPTVQMTSPWLRVSHLLTPPATLKKDSIMSPLNLLHHMRHAEVVLLVEDIN